MSHWYHNADGPADRRRCCCCDAMYATYSGIFCVSLLHCGSMHVGYYSIFIQRDTWRKSDIYQHKHGAYFVQHVASETDWV